MLTYENLLDFNSQYRDGKTAVSYSEELGIELNNCFPSVPFADPPLPTDTHFRSFRIKCPVSTPKKTG